MANSRPSTYLGPRGASESHSPRVGEGMAI